MKRLILQLLAALALPTAINALPIADMGVRLTNNEAYDEKVFITDGEIKANLKVRVTHICYMGGTDNIQLTNNPREATQIWEVVNQNEDYTICLMGSDEDIKKFNKGSAVQL